MKQTAVEWLIEQLADKGTLHSADIAKAKAMEKEQFDTLRDFDKWKEWLNKNIYDKSE